MHQCVCTKPDNLSDNHCWETPPEVRTKLKLEDEPREDFGSAENRRGEKDGRHALRRRNFGLAWAADPLQVRNNTTGFDNDEFTPPSESGGSLDGPVNVVVPVPVTCDKVHLRPNHNAAVVYFDRMVKDVEVFLHLDVTWVRQALAIVGDERVEPNDLLPMAQGLKVIGFDSTPSLFGHGGRDGKRRSDSKTTYRAPNRPFANDRHGVSC